MTALADFVARLTSDGACSTANSPRPCGFPSWTIGAETEGCTGSAHLNRAGFLRDCPAVVADRIRARVASERVRLAGALATAGGGFDAFDTNRHPASRLALDAMRRFASSATPPCAVLLSGETGLGKSHLLLASHFARLAAGYPSEYRTSVSLRPVFRALASFDADARREAEREVARLTAEPALHLDDLGDVRGTPGFHADFAAGLKGLLDSATGKMAVAVNLGSEEARAHPDLGDRVISRLVAGAEIVRLEGEDQRLPGSAL